MASFSEPVTTTHRRKFAIKPEPTTLEINLLLILRGIPVMTVLANEFIFFFVPENHETKNHLNHHHHRHLWDIALPVQYLNRQQKKVSLIVKRTTTTQKLQIN